MPFYNSPVSKISFEELEELVRDEARENARLEFKVAFPEKMELLKKLSSFANTLGGRLVIGIAADSRSGRAESLVGVTERLGFKAQVSQWCADQLDPPMTVEVSEPIPHPDKPGVCFYVLAVEESDLGPHFINGRGGLWVRSDELSLKRDAVLANEREITLLLNRKEKFLKFRDSIVHRSEARLAKFNDQRISTFGKYPRLEFSLGPRVPRTVLCDVLRLSQIFDQSSTPWRGTYFPGRSTQMVWSTQHESALAYSSDPTDERGHFVEINVWGLIFSGFGIAVKASPESTGEPVIHVPRLSGLLLLMFKYSRFVLEQMAYSGPLTLSIRLADIREVGLAHATGTWLQMAEGSPFDGNFSLPIELLTEDLNSRSDEVAGQVLREVLYALNSSHAARQDLTQIVAQGKDYNFWKNS